MFKSNKSKIKTKRHELFFLVHKSIRKLIKLIEYSRLYILFTYWRSKPASLSAQQPEGSTRSRNISRSIGAGIVCRCENVTANTVNNVVPLQREVEILALPWLDLVRPPCLYHHFQRLPPNHCPKSRLSPAAAAVEACNTDSEELSLLHIVIDI